MVIRKIKEVFYGKVQEIERKRTAPLDFLFLDGRYSFAIPANGCATNNAPVRIKERASVFVRHFA
jgi:hypothetical protein